MAIVTQGMCVDYQPPWYLRNGHLQTFITGFYRPIAPLPPAVTHQIPIGDYGAMLVHENHPALILDGAPAVFLLHGLGSSHAGTYMTNIAAALLEHGCRVFRADLPGAGSSCKTTYLPPHGACYDLVRSCLNDLSNKLGITHWRLAGVSLGGNILLKMLARHAIDPKTHPFEFEVDYAMAIAPPIDLSACCVNMEKGINRLYGGYFMRALKKQSQRRGELWDQWRTVLRKADYRSIRRFDETVTAPLAGYASAEDYYRAGSSIDELAAIEARTTILIDVHDPIVPSFLFDTTTYSPSTRLVKTRYGGHVGYLQRLRRDSNSRTSAWHRWADDRIAMELANPWCV
jgi:predicted alpha/beta-fold hydrolase